MGAAPHSRTGRTSDAHWASVVGVVLLTCEPDWLGTSGLREHLLEAGLAVVTVVARGEPAAAARDALVRIAGDDASPVLEGGRNVVDAINCVLKEGGEGQIGLVVLGLRPALLAHDSEACAALRTGLESVLARGAPVLAISCEDAEASVSASDPWAGVVAAEWACWSLAAPPPAPLLMSLNLPAVRRQRIIKSLAPQVDAAVTSGYRSLSGNMARGRLVSHASGTSDDPERLALQAGHVTITGLLTGARHARRHEAAGWLHAATSVLNGRLGADGDSCRAGCCG